MAHLAEEGVFEKYEGASLFALGYAPANLNSGQKFGIHAQFFGAITLTAIIACRVGYLLMVFDFKSSISAF